MSLKTARESLVREPRAFAEGHVRLNYTYVHSCALDERCGGYCDKRNYIYRIGIVDNMFLFSPPDEKSPKIWANSRNKQRDRSYA